MADQLLISTFEVEGFRAIRHARFPRLGRVNLFVGQNNSGKTSLLEAIQLFLDRHSDSLPAIVVELVRWHSELRLGVDTTNRNTEPHELQNTVDAVEALFYGSFAGEPLRCIRFMPAVGAGEELRLSLPWSSGWALHGEQVESGRPSLIDPYAPLLHLDREATHTVLSLDWISHRVPLPTSDGRDVAAFIPPTGFSQSRTREMWDRVMVSGEESLVEEAVRTVVPDLERILVVGELRFRKVLFKLRSASRPVPIRSLGDGANRIFGLAVALVQARGGALLIDEVENGLHHSVQSEAWGFIFALAEQLNVQVFATTHSWDAVVGFQDAALRSEAAGMLYRLEREDDGAIYAEAYTDKEVAIAAEQQVEVR